jgi:predicted CoA-binding protein
MLDLEDEEAVAAHILRTYRRIAVVGLSDNPRRPSFEVASYLRGAGYDILPVNPQISRWRDLPAYADLHATPPPIEVVDIFRRSELVEPIVADAIAVRARAVWMQDGVVNLAAARAARDAGILVVMDRCMLRDHRGLHD